MKQTRAGRWRRFAQSSRSSGERTMSSVATPASWLFSIINGARNGFFYGIFVRPLPPPRRSIARPAAEAARARGCRYGRRTPCS